MSFFGGLLEKATDWGHTALDIVGLVPVVGNLADLGNAYWYHKEGDTVMAGMSLLAAIPGAGQAVTGTKLALKAGRAAKVADTAYLTAKQATKTTKATLTKATAASGKGTTKASKASSTVEKGRKAVAKSKDALKKLRNAKGGFDPTKVAAAQKALKTKKQILKQAKEASRKAQKKAGKLQDATDIASKANVRAGAAASAAAATGKGASQFASKGVKRRVWEASTTPGIGKVIGGKGFLGKAANVAMAVENLSPATRRDAARREWRSMTPEEKEEAGSKNAFLKKVEDIHKAGSEYESLSPEQKENFPTKESYLAYKTAKEQYDALPAEEQAQYESVDDYLQQQQEAAKIAAEQARIDAAAAKKGLLPGDEPGAKKKAKKGARKQRKEEAAKAERKDARRTQRREDDRYKFDKRMALKEAQLGRKEERKAATVIDDKHALADEMLNSMGNEPDFFKNNPIEKGLYWKRARKLGVTADQFNNYINRNYKEGQRLHRQREYERDSAEGRAWLNEKLDQPSLGQMGIPTPSARGRNIGRFKTGEVSPTKTEVRESVRESDEDERKRERRLTRGRRKIEDRGDKRRGRGGKKRDEEERGRGSRRGGKRGKVGASSE